MKKKSLSAIMIALLLTTEAITISPFASTLKTTPCPCEGNEQCDKKVDTKKHRNPKDDVGFWNKDNVNLLNDSQKKQLETIKEKMQKGETLTDEDKKTLFDLKDTIAKSKLGEEKFNKLKALMEKRKQGTQLTEEETKELKQYLKELK